MLNCDASVEDKWIQLYFNVSLRGEHANLKPLLPETWVSVGGDASE